MPPIKGSPLLTQQKIANNFLKTKHAERTKKGQRFKNRGKKTEASLLSGNPKQDEALLKLRIPLEIRKILPSVRRFVGGGMKKAGEATSVKVEVKTEPEKAAAASTVVGLKRRRWDQQKYYLKVLSEELFEGMIWDVAFTPRGSVIVCSSEGAFMCSDKLKGIRKMENVILAGSVAFLSDDRIVIICRNMDTVNFYLPNGVFVKAFHTKPSPMGLVVNSRNEIIISDTGARNVQIYNPSGTKLREIPTTGTGYQFKWPLYMALMSTDDLIVSDCHQQQVMTFDKNDRHQATLPLKTHPGNQVLRPHGICVNNFDDIFVIDMAIDTLEVFTPEGNFMHTLLPSEEGALLKPKALRTNKDGTLLIVGGLTGFVRIYQFVGSVKEEVLASTKNGHSVTTPRAPPVKKEKISENTTS